MERFIKTSVEDECPKENGKYIVFTRTTMGGQNIFETTFHWSEGKKPKTRWGCTNQIVTNWLKQEL